MARIATELRELRSSLRLSQKEMVGDVVSASFYSKVERGLVGINAETLIDILLLHDVNLGDFFDRLERTNSNYESPKQKNWEAELEDAFYHNNLEQAKKIKKKVEKSNDLYLYLLAILISAALEDRIEEIPEKTKAKIRKEIFNFSNYNKYILKLFCNGMAIYPIDQMSFQVNAILCRYSHPENLSTEMQELLATICTNFLYNCYRKNMPGLIELPIKYLFSMPNRPQLYLCRLLALYFQSFFEQDSSKCVGIKKQMMELGYKGISQKLKK